MLSSAGLLVPFLVISHAAATVIQHPSAPPLTFQLGDTDSLFPTTSDDPWSSLSLPPASDPTHEDNDAPVDPPKFNPALAPFPPVHRLWLGLIPPRPLVNIFHGILTSFPALPPIHTPYFHPHHQLPDPIDLKQFTIGQVLNWTLHHTPKPHSYDDHHHPPPLHRLAWLVNTSQSVQDLLYDPKADLTLFAPDDEALTPPHKRKEHGHPDHIRPTKQAINILWDALESFKLDDHLDSLDLDDHPDKLKFLLHAIELVLKYHISPGSKTLREILDRSTLPTELPVFPWSKTPQFRLRVGPALPRLSKPGHIILNFFTILDSFKSRPILTKNGVIYIVERAPLLPPLSPLSQLFLFPGTFSTLTSAIQKTHLNDILLPHWANKSIPLSAPTTDLTPSTEDESVDERISKVLSQIMNDGEHSKLSKRSFTIFAPTNHAFRKLGPEANAFLFSPFGADILKYVLSYHIVPDIIWNTDHCDCPHNECGNPQSFVQSISPVSPIQDSLPGLHPPPITGKVNVTHLSLPTLVGHLKNESLPISVVKFQHHGNGPVIRHVLIRQPKSGEEEGEIVMSSKDSIPVVVADGVAWGGALHLIPSVIKPPCRDQDHHHHLSINRKDVQRAIQLSILSPS